MKILFILGFANPFPGAGWTRIGFFADAWSRKGCSIEILGTFSYKSIQRRGARKSENASMFNIIFNTGVSHPLIFILNSFVSLVVSTLFLFAKKPHIAIISMPAGDFGLGALLACRLTGVKYIVDYRDQWEDYALSLTTSKIGKSFYSGVKKLVAILYAESQLVTAVTPTFADSLRRRGVANIRLVPNGADVTIFKPSTRKKKNEAFAIFHSGGIGGYYRLDVAVKALRKLVDNGMRNVKLVIAGEGEVQKILDLALELGISSHIDYKGSISDKAELVRLISESDAGLIPYDDNPLWKNSLPAKFFEYCACGIPVIATVYVDSLLAEISKGYDVGMISPPMDEQKLAEAIRQLYKRKSFRKAAGKRARSLIEEKFDRNKIAEKFLNLVRECT